jgi:hypothetical protein
MLTSDGTVASLKLSRPTQSKATPAAQQIRDVEAYHEDIFSKSIEGVESFSFNDVPCHPQNVRRGKPLGGFPSPRLGNAAAGTHIATLFSHQSTAALRQQSALLAGSVAWLGSSAPALPPNAVTSSSAE